MRFGAEYLENQ